MLAASLYRGTACAVLECGPLFVFHCAVSCALLTLVQRQSTMTTRRAGSTSSLLRAVTTGTAETVGPYVLGKTISRGMSGKVKVLFRASVCVVVVRCCCE